MRARLAAAARAAGRAPEDVRLVAVSKKMPADDVRAALAAGQLDFGESYGQELRDKRRDFASTPTSTLPSPRWHFIGPLQANKVKYVAGHVALVHSVDSAELVDELERRAVPQACLVQVNVAGEAQKRGVAPADLPALLDRFAALRHVTCAGLMTVPPLVDDPEAARPHFAALRALRDREAAHARAHVELRELSMGMSHDLEVAVAEGATFVRVGTAIFGTRVPVRP
ncbi:MAG TPA: YggS family pyridoxal phosphate-dependent enzyme [Polyangia bacterium]|nr:YggS family pyridoxal phosphate-dependent enzyme [Polyangia bacterium]